MKTKQKVYLRTIFILLLFLAYKTGNEMYGTPMKSYNYAIFLIISIYYYLTDFLEFNSLGGKYRPWLTSLGINIFLSTFLWTFSKSGILFFKFFILWIFSNLLRVLLLKFEDKTLKAIYIGEKEKFSDYKNGNNNYIKFVDYLELKTDTEAALKYIEENKIELVVLEATVIKNNPKEFLDLKLSGVKVFLPWQYRESIDRKIDVRTISNKWFLHNQGFDILNDTFERKIKRGVDLLAACGVGVFAVPLIGGAALIMKVMGILDKKTAGPLFFKQIRIGLGNKPFEILKFRTMITKEHWAEVGFDPNMESWTEADDPRITKLGKFMRKTRIDELPQLINVFRGEMSFVGPRPESESYVKILEEEVPFYALRHTVLPGLTGWAQVMYPYGASVEDALHKLEYDLYYIKHQTFIMDLMVFFKTVKIVVFGRGR